MRSSETICAPSGSRRSRTAGDFIASTAAALSFFTIGSGVSFGRNSAFHV